MNSFSFRDNGFKCNNCKKMENGAYNISDGAKNAIIYSIKADSKKIFSFNLSEKSEKEFEVVSKLYLDEKLEKEYKIERLF